MTITTEETTAQTQRLLASVFRGVFKNSSPGIADFTRFRLWQAGELIMTLFDSSRNRVCGARAAQHFPRARRCERWRIIALRRCRGEWKRGRARKRQGRSVNDACAPSRARRSDVGCRCGWCDLGGGLHRSNAAAAIRAMTEALAIREERGEPANVRITAVPNRFVTGEASALVHWLNEGDARPTLRPPRVFGARGRRTSHACR